MGEFDVTLPGSGIVEILGETVNTGETGDLYVSRHLYNGMKKWGFVYGVTGSPLTIDDLVTSSDSMYLTGTFGPTGYYISKFSDNGELDQTVILNTGNDSIDKVSINGVPVTAIESTENGERKIGLNYYKKYKFEPGKALGKIDSLVGSNPWAKFDLHSSTSTETSITLSDAIAGMEVPLMCHVVASAYGSMVPGPNSWRWTLRNYLDETVIRVLNSPYFSYTFDSEGSYKLELELLDANGNVVAKNDEGFIKVRDHRKILNHAPTEGPINSFNYGYIQISSPNDIIQLGIQMDEEQRAILEDLFNSLVTVYYLVTQDGSAIVTDSGQIIRIQ